MLATIVAFVSSALLAVEPPDVHHNGQRENLAQRRSATRTADVGRDYQIPGEPEPEKLVPKEPLSVDQTKLVEARKLYTLGYVSLKRKKLEQAYELFTKALEYDPGSLAVLKELVPLCIRLQKGKEGLQYCRQALRLDPDNYALLQFYAQQMEEQGDVDAAIDALEAASKNPKLREADITVLIGMLDKLADLYAERKDYVGMARALRELVDIAENPGRYEIDAMVRRQLVQQKVRLYEKLGEALKGAKQYEEAVVVLERGIASQAGGRRLALTLAEVLFETGQYAQALDHLKGQLGQTQSLQSFELYEKLLQKLDRGDELLPALKELVDKDRYNPVLAQFYAQKLMEHKRFPEAREMLEPIKDRPEASAALAELYIQTNEPLKLLQTLASNLRVPQTVGQIRVIAQKPEFVKEMGEAAKNELREDDPQRFQIDYVVALTSNEAKLTDQAKEFYERCIEQRPELALLYKELIDLLYKQERYEEVVAVASRAIEKHPSEFQFFDDKARALTAQKKYDEAVELIGELKKNLADRDQMVSADLLLAWVYQMQENWDRAAEICKKVLDENPEPNRVHYTRYLLSNIYTLKGDLKLAEEQLLLLVESDPQHMSANIRAAANNDLGYIWADEGKNLERARHMVETALDLNEKLGRPASAAYLDSMGWVLYKSQDYAGAVRYLKQATEAESGEDGVIWDHLGDAYLQLNKTDKAREAWMKAIELYKKAERESDRAKAAQVQEKINMLAAGDDAPPERATSDSP